MGVQARRIERSGGPHLHDTRCAMEAPNLGKRAAGVREIHGVFGHCGVDPSPPCFENPASRSAFVIAPTPHTTWNTHFWHDRHDRHDSALHLIHGARSDHQSLFIAAARPRTTAPGISATRLFWPTQFDGPCALCQRAPPSLDLSWTTPPLLVITSPPCTLPSRRASGTACTPEASLGIPQRTFWPRGRRARPARRHYDPPQHSASRYARSARPGQSKCRGAPEAKPSGRPCCSPARRGSPCARGAHV